MPALLGRLTGLLAAAWCALSVAAAGVTTAPDPDAAAADPALLRIWGHGSRDNDYLSQLIRVWSEGFRRLHPEVRIQTTLRGDATGIGGLYTAAADLALMEREPLAIELDGYRSVLGEDPFRITVATGSLDRPHRAMAPLIFVHKNNPLRQLSLQQLDAILGADHRRGPKNIRTWGELGLKGGWADKPITVYTSQLVGDVPQYLQAAVMEGSQKWTASLHEFGAGRSGQDRDADAGAQVIAALARDPAGLAIAHWIHRTPEVVVVALAAQAGGPYVLPSRRTLMQHAYPLTRSVYFYMQSSPGKVMAPAVDAWARHVLSPEGQRAIAQEGGYLPLTPELARRELERLP